MPAVASVALIVATAAGGAAYPTGCDVVDYEDITNHTKKCKDVPVDERACKVFISKANKIQYCALPDWGEHCVNAPRRTLPLECGKVPEGPADVGRSFRISTPPSPTQIPAPQIPPFPPDGRGPSPRVRQNRK